MELARVNPLYDSRLLQSLDTKLRETILRKQQELGSGTQIVHDDAAATGMKAVKYMGAIEGLNLALQLMEQTHKEMSGKAKKD